MLLSKSNVSDVNQELRNILLKHKTANRIIIHVGKNDIRKEQQGLNTWLERSCGIKGVNFIDNINIFWGHRQLFKLDGFHPNKFGTRVLKDNNYLSLRHLSVVYADPLGLDGTHLDRV